MMETKKKGQHHHIRRHNELIRRHTNAALRGLSENIEIHSRAYDNNDVFLRETIKLVISEIIRHLLGVCCRDDFDMSRFKNFIKAEVDSMSWEGDEVVVNKQLAGRYYKKYANEKKD